MILYGLGCCDQWINLRLMTALPPVSLVISYGGTPASVAHCVFSESAPFQTQRALFDKFCTAWNACSDMMLRQGCHSLPPPPEMSLSCPIAFSCPHDSNISGMYVRALVHNLVQLQNTFLRSALGIVAGKTQDEPHAGDAFAIVCCFYCPRQHVRC